MVRLSLPETVLACIRTIEAGGFEAYCVGGCVRDLLLGRDAKDYDLATDGRPAEIARLFDRVLETGIRHGTVTVLQNGMAIEVTRYRSDGVYLDHRRPEQVAFVDHIEEDLSRRDFTINAMAYHPEKGLLDPFGGQADLAAGVIRSVGEPARRFDEDALRILRAFRFASTLGFMVEPETLAASAAAAPLLRQISRERILAELTGLLSGRHPEALEPLLACGGLDFLGLRFRNSLSQLQILPSDTALRFAALCFLCGADETEVLKNLKSSTALAGAVRAYCREFRQPLPPSPAVLKKRLSGLSPERWELLLAARETLLGEDTAFALEWLEKILRENQPYTLAMLAVNGRDIAALGGEGRQIGVILDKLLSVVLEDPSQNKKEALLKLARRLLSGH